MLVNACYVSHTGKVRHHNEDSLLLNDLLISGADVEEVKCLQSEEERHIFIVADGMGGHQKGEVASRTVLTAFKDKYGQANNKEDIMEIMRLAREELNRIVEDDEHSYGLGTTIAGILIVEDRALIFSCGDSRIYHLRGDSLERITKDHSCVQELVDAGVIAEDEMRSHPQRNVITSSLTGDGRRGLPEIEMKELPVAKGQKFLLCSDGLWESMRLDAMEECYSNRYQKEIVECLYEKTMKSGARDNLSVIALEIGGFG